MKEAFEVVRLHGSSKEIIKLANGLIEEYAANNLGMTLRGLYYQFIARDLFPADWIDAEYNLKNRLSPDTKNTIKNYKNFVYILGRARMGGMTDWDAVTDEGRFVREINSWNSTQEIINSLHDQFHRDLWRNQQYRPIVLVEKDALLNVLQPVSRDLRIGLLSCRGYVSLQALYDLSKTLLSYHAAGQTPVMIQMSDHDPSGIDMSRDIQEKMNLFMQPYTGEDLTYIRLALNMDQVDEYNPPPNPAKITDKRFASYQKLYGDESWELDALDPAVMAKMVRDEVAKYRDDKQFEKDRAVENHDKHDLENLKIVWPAANRFCRKQRPVEDRKAARKAKRVAKRAEKKRKQQERAAKRKAAAQKKREAAAAKKAKRKK